MMFAYADLTESSCSHPQLVALEKNDSFQDSKYGWSDFEKDYQGLLHTHASRVKQLSSQLSK